MKENRETFFKRLPGLSPADQFLLEFAYDIAKEGHGYLNQVRDGGERYFEHVRAVTLILIDVFGIRDINILIPALFHDLPEDTYIWKVPGRITHVFGKVIGSRAHVLAKPDKTKFSTKEKHLFFYFDQVKTNGWEVCLIKVADRIHNLGSMDSGSWSTEKQHGYVLETERYFLDAINIIYTSNKELGDKARVKIFEAINNVKQKNK